MKRHIIMDGYLYRLRPVLLSDAEVIISLRREDKDRNRFINPISEEKSVQEEWLNRYFERENDYYFVVENKLTQKVEGLISIYDIVDNKAEWGRWVIRKGSLAAIESVDLMYKVAFNVLDLDEVYSRTITENTTIINFHDDLPQKRRGLLKENIRINNILYNRIEHFTCKNFYFSELQEKLEKKSSLVFQRNFKQYLGTLSFHHIGVATINIQKELEGYKMLGYTKESDVFEDVLQGIKGLFIIAPNQPRLELLENLEGSNTLDNWLDTKNKMYHFAYIVKNIEKVVEVFSKNRIKMVAPLKQSVYFKKRICFMMLSNSYIIELIEE